MTNQNKFKALPGGETCKPKSPHYCYEMSTYRCYELPDCPLCKGCIADIEFDKTAPTYDLTEPMEEGKVFEGVGEWQYKSVQGCNWIKYNKTVNPNDIHNGTINIGGLLYDIRMAINPIQPIKEEKEVPSLQQIFDEVKDNPKIEDLLQAVDANKEQTQPFEKFPALAEILLHAANNWKVDGGSNWNRLLYEINKICTLYSELEQVTDKVEDLQILLDAERGQQSQSVDTKGLDVESDIFSEMHSALTLLLKAYQSNTDTDFYNLDPEQIAIKALNSADSFRSGQSVESIVGLTVDYIVGNTDGINMASEYEISAIKASIIKELKK